MGVVAAPRMTTASQPVSRRVRAAVPPAYESRKAPVSGPLVKAAMRSEPEKEYPASRLGVKIRRFSGESGSTAGSR